MPADAAHRLIDALKLKVGLEWYRFLDQPVPVVVWRYSQDAAEAEGKLSQAVGSYPGRVEWLLSKHARTAGGHTWALRPARLDTYQDQHGLPSDSAAVSALAETRPDWCSEAVSDFHDLVQALIAVLAT